MGVVTVICMLIKEYFPLVGKRYSFFRFVPAPLIAIFVAILFEYAIIRPTGSWTPTISDVAKFQKATAYPQPYWTQTMFFDKSKFVLDSAGWGKIWSQGILLFFIGTIESLMVIQMMDGFTATVGNNNQQIAVLGAANIISGFLGGAGGDAMIGMSILNGLNGAQGRVSSLACGLGIMILIMVAYPVLNFIPVSALAGIMFVVTIHIFKWYAIDMVICAFVPSKLRVMLRLPSRKVNRADVIIIVAIVLLTYYKNLFYGILAGVGFSFVIFMIQVKTTGGSWVYIWHSFTKPISAERKVDESGNRVVYIIRGPLYFKSFRTFPTLFDYYNDPTEVVIYMEDGKLYDYSSLEGLNKVCKEFKLAGKSVAVMNLSEKSQRMVRKADGSRSYGCCPITFQWILGDIEIAPDSKEKDPLDDDDDDDGAGDSGDDEKVEHPIDSSKMVLVTVTQGFVGLDEIQSTPAAFVMDETVPTPNMYIRH
jgi:MFS superfamily sulfate permease-like transporter